MKNTIIYLLGFPGTGKYTIAKEICKQADVKLVDNHLINNPVFTLVERDGKTKLPDSVWEQTAKIRAIVLDTMKTLSPPDYNFVFTNALVNEDPDDLDIYKSVKNTAETREACLVPIRLTCEIEKNMQRIISPDRKKHMKELSPELAREIRKNHSILETRHSNELTLDVSDLTAKDAAKTILDHARNCA